MPLIVTRSSRLGPLAGARSISRDDNELSDEMEVPEGERGIEVSAAEVKSGWAANPSRCSSKSLKSSDRSFCQAMPSIKHSEALLETPH